MVEQFYEPPPTLKDRKENPLNEDWLTAAPIKSTEAGLGLVSQIESKVEPIAQTIDSFGSWQHLSTSGIIVITMILTWFITYFRFAFAWYFAVLWVISLVYSRNMTRFYKKVRNQALKDYSLNQIDVDQEKVEWFNQFLRRFWINYEPSLSASIKSVIDSSLEYYKPAFLEELVLTDFCLGSQAPRIEAIKTFAGTDDEMLIMDWDLTFMPFDDQSVSQLERNLRDLRNVSVVLKATLGVLPLTVAIKELYLSGRMRVQLKFFNGFPHIQSVDIGFVSTPSMDFKLVPLGTGDINKLGGLGDYIRTTVDGIVASILVNPVKMNFPIGAWFDASAGQTESPVVTVAEAKGLKNKDVTGISDPATVIKLGGTEIARTRVIDNTLDPKWNEVFHVVIYKSTLTQLDSKSDELKFEVFHVAPIGSKSLGITSTLKLHKWIKLLELPEENTDGTQEELTKEEKENLLLEWGSPMETYSAEVWKKLVTPGKKSSGSLRINLSYFPVLGNGPVTNLDELNLSHKAGIITVYVHQAKELMKAGIHSSVLECAAYFDGEEMFRTAHRKRTSNPSWESKHVFYCPDIGIANYNFKILNKGESIGEVKINLAHAIKATDDWYKLFGNPVGKVRISVKFSQLDAGQTMVDRTKTTNQEPLGLARITVLGAKDLENTEILGSNFSIIVGKSDPYARVYLQGRNVGITAHRENTLAPVWNETFYTMAYSLKEQITMEVFDFNNLAKDKPLGKAELPIGPLLAFLNPDRSSLDMNQIGKFELDGLTVTVKEGQTLDVWAPIYLNTVIETDADMEENEPAPRDSLGKSFFKKTKANLTSFTQDIKTGKVRQKGHIHFELNLFHILQDYSVEAQDVLYVVRKSMNETPVQATLPLSPQDTHAETPTSLQEKSSSAVEAKEKIAEKPAATTDAAGRVSLVSTQIGSNESLAVVESNTANILEKVNAHRTGILSIKIKSGEFNRRVRPYVTISSVHGDEKVLFSTFAPPTAKSIVYWHAGNDRFITDIVSTKFVLYVRDQFGESPSDKDYILGVWKGDFVTELLGKKNNWVNFHQYSLRETDCEKLPITCRINLGFSFFPVELDVAVNDKYDTGVLQFDLLSAKNLPAVDSNGFSDPYCIITLNGNNVHKSKIHKKTLNPVFDERIYIDIYSRMKSTIDLHLKDYNQFTHNVSLGHCRIPLSTIVPDQVINITVPLDIGQGTVDICFIFQPKEIAKPLTSNVTESRLATETTALGKFGRGLTSQVTGLGSLMTGKKKSSGAVKSAISPLSSQDGLGALEHPEPPTDQTPKSYGLESRRPNRPKNADDDSQKPHAPPPIVENTAEKDEDTPLSLRAPEQDIKLVEDFIPGRNSATNMNSSTSVPDIRVKSPSPALPDVERASVASLRSISNGNKINFHIHSARGLQGVDRGGTSDPYVKVTAPDVKKSIYKTAVIKKSLNPIWHDEKFTVPSTTESLKFTVLDKNMISNDVELGYVDLNLVELLAHTDSVDEWFEMKGYSGGQVRISFEKIATDEPQPKRVSSNHSMYSGILKLGRKRASSNASQI
ncbi:hypothetical protein HK103_000903 [Boothiomyces macroporosus]|uniref:Uncharacterized protein n=1 Tax=Boothiomyces macroporosus TaxID=261099 RepID=A0AAD5UMA6_9FUNG|nr:hypothetical protein HK103_000903 [Boothiomyces macroporosus]